MCGFRYVEMVKIFICLFVNVGRLIGFGWVMMMCLFMCEFGVCVYFLRCCLVSFVWVKRLLGKRFG